MSISRFRSAATAGWLIAVIVSLSASIAFRTTPVSIHESLAWLLLSTVPPLIVWSLFRGAAPQTIAQVLYDVEQPAGPGDAGRGRS